MSYKTALLVIDLQRWFLEVGSPEKLNSVEKLIEKTNDLIQFFQAENLPIIKIQTVHKADKSTWNLWALEHNVGRLIEGTKEAELSPALTTVDNEIIITKTRHSAFIRTQLEDQLQKLSCNQVVICGYSTDNCVGQTAIDAYEYDFKVLLAGEAILGTKVIHGEMMLESLKRRFEIEPISNSKIKTLLKQDANK